MSAAIHIDTRELDALNGRLADLARLDTRRLMDHVGAEVETQTRRRIASEKESPAGEAWPVWSEDYRETRGSGDSLLQSEGDLLDSIHHVASRQATEVGSNLVYAATHQWGDPARNIPQRQYLGLSDANEADLTHVVNDWLADQLRRTLQ